MVHRIFERKQNQRGDVYRRTHAQALALPAATAGAAAAAGAVVTTAAAAAATAATGAVAAAALPPAALPPAAAGLAAEEEEEVLLAAFCLAISASLASARATVCGSSPGSRLTNLPLILGLESASFFRHEYLIFFRQMRDWRFVLNLATMARRSSGVYTPTRAVPGLSSTTRGDEDDREDDREDGAEPLLLLRGVVFTGALAAASAAVAAATAAAAACPAGGVMHPASAMMRRSRFLASMSLSFRLSAERRMPLGTIRPGLAARDDFDPEPDARFRCRLAASLSRFLRARSFWAEAATFFFSLSLSFLSLALRFSLAALSLSLLLSLLSLSRWALARFVLACYGLASVRVCCGGGGGI